MLDCKLNSGFLTVVDADDEPTIPAELGIEMVKTTHAERLAFPHDIPLASQRPRAFGAGEMSQVPMSSLRLGALVGQDELEFA